MKRFLLLSVLAGVLVLACQKSGNASDSDPEAPAETGEEASAQDSDGYALRVNTPYYTLETDTGEESDRTRWAGTMALGEKVFAGFPRRATFAGDGKPYDFIGIRREDGTRGLAFASHIAQGGGLAVVIDENANLYRTAKSIDVTGLKLPRRTVAVLFPETERDGFAEIRAYDPQAQATRRNFVRLSSLSRETADIQSSILLQTALPLKNEGTEKIRRDALLEAALLDYPASVFREEIYGLAHPAPAGAGTEPSAYTSLTVHGADVNVRDLPDPVAGNITGHLNRGMTVTVIEQTAGESTIDGRTARWYRLSAPVAGWVFGGYLEE